MFADKLPRALSCTKWIVFKRLEPNIIKPLCSVNRNLTNKYQLVKRLLYSNNLRCASSTRCFSTLPGHKENLHAHNVMANMTAYSNSVSATLPITEDLTIDTIENILDKQWISMSNSEILENFKILSLYVNKNSEDVNHTKYKGIFEILSEKCPGFSKDELINFLSLFQLWNSGNLYQNMFWRVVDKACVDKLPELNIEEIFLINDYFYNMNVIMHSSFNYHSMRKLDPKKMTPPNLVQYAFFMKVKGVISGIKIDQFEFCVGKNIDKFSIEELGVICMAFFKYQTAIKSENLLLKVLEKLQTDVDNVSDISMASILKALRFSANLNTLQVFDVLLKTLQDQVADRHLLTLTHIAQTQATILIHNSDLMKEILNKFERELNKARIKDIERLLFSLYIFNYSPETTSFYTMAEKELKNPDRVGEIDKFIKPFVYCIMYMLQVNHFPEELVNKIMTQDFIKKFCNNDISTLDREYLVMDYCLQIDHPEYKGPKLRKDQLRYLLRKFGVFQPESNKKFQKIDHAGKLMMDITHHIKQTIGSESGIHVDCPLPYYNRQYIIICYDPVVASFVPPGEPLAKIPLGEIKYAPKDGKQWSIIIPVAHNMQTRNSCRPTGILAMQMRHMEKIGYKPVMVPFDQWNQLRTSKKKIEYLAQILNDLQTNVAKM